MSNERYRRLEASAARLNRITEANKFVLGCPAEQCSELLRHSGESKAQLFQDLFALSVLNFKHGGFFVEFGATNGVDLSNTFLLEKRFGWNGILAEPGRTWHETLRRNRNCNIETACVWKESGASLIFNATEWAELGTIDSFSSSDHHAQRRDVGSKYEVNTISLIDLLEKYSAPHVIDYLSIDTEGSEGEILSSFDFDRYKFRLITCEHNFSSERETIYSLLTKNGYERKYEAFSDFDDWYVLTRTDVGFSDV